jgi:penicillin amidase
VHSLCYRNEDLENTEIVQKLGERFFEKYYPSWNQRQKPIIREHEKISPRYSESTTTTNRKFSTRLQQPDRANGSNNWAVHRSQTVAQKNLLANDPHLDLSLPSLWYELHIHLPERQIYGVSFPGIPGIVLGFNDEIAWGSTNVSHDVADWLSPVWKDSSSWTYFYEGKWHKADIEKEVIYVRDQDSVVLKIPKTKLGRIPFPEKDHDLHGMAFYWAPLESQGSNLFKTFMEFNLAGSYSEFKNALKYFTFPAQNFVFADRDDTIALHVQGKLPSREIGQGFFVQDSMTTKILSHSLAQEKLPREINPKRGYVGSANQHSTYPEFPYEYRGYFDGFRGRTLDSLLRIDNPKTFEEMKKIQLSTFSLEAKEALPLLLEYLEIEASSSSDEIQLLENWDYSYLRKSKAATLFSIWWNKFQERVFEHLELPINPDSWRLIQIMDSNPNDTLFYMHPDSIERGLKNISTRAYREALDEYQKLDNKAWYAFKGTVIPHLGQIDAFSSRLLENGGTRNALNSVKKSHGPSWRMIVELGDTIRAEGVYPGGQSGNPGSPYYNNFVEDWEEGKYHPLKMKPIDQWGERVTKWEIKTK